MKAPTPPAAALRALLADSPTRAIDAILVRCVFKEDFDKGTPHTYLYTSKAANRLNSAGVRALYLAEDRPTALLEHTLPWKGLPREHEPTILFSARLRLAQVIDLADPATLRHLGLTQTDVEDEWKLSTTPTPLQRLGDAVAAQKGIAAVRYPSAAQRVAKGSGWNVVTFPTALATPDTVEILGAGGNVIESWP